jgi:NAD(P)H-quinone oxidoreductase subunit 5
MTFETATLPWLAPALYLAAGVAVLNDRERAWRYARLGATAALLGAAAAAIGLVGSCVAGVPAGDGQGAVMALLVTFLGWVIVGFSRRYLRGEPGQRRYLLALLITLAAVTVVAVTRHFGLLVVAWSVSSLGLHSLLTFYPDRPAAQIVAHKKFIASRCAELCLVGALALIHSETMALDFARIAHHVATLDSLPWTLHAAAALIALAALLKSAQLPVHGWLIQVMEAPTPVSALLHAGIVNVAGFVLIRLADLLSVAPVAQALLVLVGASTAVLAGLVTTTRISIKVRLAWSTCAQMGFMLLECGLGLYDLAMLHIVAHSLYKAHAFLTTGESVQATRVRDFAPAAAMAPGARALLARLGLGALAAAALVQVSLLAWQRWLPRFEIPWVALWIVSIGLAPLFWGAQGMSGIGRAAVRVLVLTQAYVLWHLAFLQFTPLPIAAPPVLVAFAAAAFAGLYGLQGWFLARPGGRLATRVYPWAYAGFYLDERFTRTVFHLWPAPAPAERPAPGWRATRGGERA